MSDNLNGGGAPGLKPDSSSNPLIISPLSSCSSTDETLNGVLTFSTQFLLSLFEEEIEGNFRSVVNLLIESEEPIFNWLNGLLVFLKEKNPVLGLGKLWGRGLMAHSDNTQVAIGAFE